jgi:hypothetical protein
LHRGFRISMHSQGFPACALGTRVTCPDFCTDLCESQANSWTFPQIRSTPDQRGTPLRIAAHLPGRWATGPAAPEAACRTRQEDGCDLRVMRRKPKNGVSAYCYAGYEDKCFPQRGKSRQNAVNQDTSASPKHAPDTPRFGVLPLPHGPPKKSLVRASTGDRPTRGPQLNGAPTPFRVCEVLRHEILD